MTVILIIDHEAEFYAERFKQEFAEIVVHTAHSPNDALKLDVLHDVEVIVALAHNVTDDVVERTPKLRWISALTTGVDHLSTLKSLPRDVLITSARGVHGPQMAELTFLYMISLSRNFRGMLENQMSHKWERWPQRLLFGKTVTIVGIGSISEELAVRCKAFGMEVVGVSSARSQARGFDQIVPRSQLAEVAAQTDFLVVLVPYSKATHHMIDASVLGCMKPSSFVINIARGNVIDETALIDHLAQGKIGGAGLDVFAQEPPADTNPLWTMKNVVMTPRIGGMSDVYSSQILPLLKDNLRMFIEESISTMRNVVTLGSDQ